MSNEYSVRCYHDIRGFDDGIDIFSGCKLEPALAEAAPEDRVQFERLGYFVADRNDHQAPSTLVFNRTIGLRDSWAKLEKKRTQGKK